MLGLDDFLSWEPSATGRSQLLTFVPAPAQPKEEASGGLWSSLSYYLTAAPEDPHTAEEQEQATATRRLRALVERCGVATVLADSKLLPPDALVALVAALTGRAGLVYLSQQTGQGQQPYAERGEETREAEAVGVESSLLLEAWLPVVEASFSYDGLDSGADSGQNAPPSREHGHYQSVPAAVSRALLCLQLLTVRRMTNRIIVISLIILIRISSHLNKPDNPKLLSRASMNM
jgi:hypothetical protein